VSQAAIKRAPSRRDVPLREKTLWRMLYETAARASEVLALDVNSPGRSYLAPGRSFRSPGPTGAGPGRMAGRAVPAWRDPPAAGLHRQPVPATLTTTPCHSAHQGR
jgi:hypothetical protein